MPVYKRYVGMTLIFLILGGFILGPVVQKFSFGAVLDRMAPWG